LLTIQRNNLRPNVGCYLNQLAALETADSFAQWAAADAVLLAELRFVDLGAWWELAFNDGGANLAEYRVGQRGSF